MTEDRVTTEDLSARLIKMEAMQMNHFRSAIFLLLYFTVAFACLAWEWNRHVKGIFEALPIATVVVICVWVACVVRHARDLSRLRKAYAESMAGSAVSQPGEETEGAVEPATDA